jgi:hypothetical protein
MTSQAEALQRLVSFSGNGSESRRGPAPGFRAVSGKGEGAVAGEGGAGARRGQDGDEGNLAMAPTESDPDFERFNRSA